VLSVCEQLPNQSTSACTIDTVAATRHIDELVTVVTTIFHNIELLFVMKYHDKQQLLLR
jgi:hypothetical protein